MELEAFFGEIMSFAEECGMVKKESSNPKGNTIVRDNARGKQNNIEE